MNYDTIPLYQIRKELGNALEAMEKQNYGVAKDILTKLYDSLTHCDTSE